MQRARGKAREGDRGQGESIQELDGKDLGELGVAEGADPVNESELDGSDNAHPAS